MWKVSFPAATALQQHLRQMKRRKSMRVWRILYCKRTEWGVFATVLPVKQRMGFSLDQDSRAICSPAIFGDLFADFELPANPVKPQGWRWAAGCSPVVLRQQRQEEREPACGLYSFWKEGATSEPQSPTAARRNGTDDSSYLTPGSLSLFKVSCLSHIAANYLNAGKEARRWGTAHESIVPYQVTPWMLSYQSYCSFILCSIPAKQLRNSVTKRNFSPKRLIYIIVSRTKNI